VGDGALRGTAVPGGRGDEDAGLGRVVEGDLDRVVDGDREPDTEKFRTSTPSPTAASMAATVSELTQPPLLAVSFQQIL